MNVNKENLNEPNSKSRPLSTSSLEVNKPKRKTKVLLTKEQEKIEFYNTLTRFLKNTPFYVESKDTLDKKEKEHLYFTHEIVNGKKKCAERDDRFNGLLGTLNEPIQ